MVRLMIGMQMKIKCNNISNGCGFSVLFSDYRLLFNLFLLFISKRFFNGTENHVPNIVTIVGFDGVRLFGWLFESEIS